jgi:hypothetical protein
MSKHTPGPWNTEDGKERYDWPQDNYRFIYAGGSVLNPVTGQGFELTGFINADDARLIAAAPNLLRELEIAEAIIAKNTYPQPDKPDSTWAKLAGIRAAIAEAKGE